MNHQSFSNLEKFPCNSIYIFKTDNGNYAASDRGFDRVNLITVVCLMDNNRKTAMNLLLGIAKKLEWNLILEEDDFDNENILITEAT